MSILLESIYSLILYPIQLHRNYSSLYSLPLRSLRPLRLNHSDATGNDISPYLQLSKHLCLPLF